MTKITISQEGSNPISITLLDKNKSAESLNLDDLKYESGYDHYGSNVSKDTIDFISKNKAEIRKLFLKAALEYYKTSGYGEYAIDEIGKDIKKCTVDDMDKMIHGPFKVLEDSNIKKYKKCDFVITAENKLDPEHGVGVGFTKTPLKVVETSEIGYFI